MTEFELTLCGGHMRLSESVSGRSLLGDSPSVEYDLAQAAVERAIAIIAEATGRMSGDHIKEDDVLSAFEQGTLKLRLRGHVRELHVAALHLHVRYGFSFDNLLAGTLRGIHLVPETDAVDAYATYQFESDMRPLEAIRSYLVRWMLESKREPRVKNEAYRNYDRRKQLLALGSPDAAPLTVVVTGVTGAGKSTFLNGLLGRDIVPYSSDVCTAAIIRLRHATSSDAERAVVHWRSAEDIHSLAKKYAAEAEHLGQLRTKMKTAATSDVGAISTNQESAQQRIEFFNTKARAMVRAAGLRSREKNASTRINLEDLRDYSSNRSDSYAEAVKEIEVFVTHPLLAHLEIVDAPGLRDGDDERQKMLIRAFAGDTAWLYLVPADARNESCRDDWKRIKELANNDSGVLVLTKADGQPSNSGDTIETTMTRRMTAEYSETFGWRRPMTWCTALMPSRLAALRGIWEEESLESAFTDAKMPAILGLPGRAQKKRLEDFLHDNSRDSRGNQRKQTFTDYALDASRLPRVMRMVGRVLYEDAISTKVKMGRDELSLAASEAIEFCSNAIAETQSILDAHDTIAAQKQAKSRLEEQLRENRKNLIGIQSRHRTALHSIQAECDKAKKEYKKAIDEQLSLAPLKGTEPNGSNSTPPENLKTKFDQIFAKQSSSIWMSGAREFSLLEYFEQPLTVISRGKLGGLHNQMNKHLKEFLTKDLPYIRPAQTNTSEPKSSTNEIKDKEHFFEWAETAKKRMWETTLERAKSLSEELITQFNEDVECILTEAERVTSEDEAKKKTIITELEAEATGLDRAIKANDPGRSRETAMERAAAYTSHKAAFEAFLEALAPS